MEQHKFNSRRGHMWIKWFSYSTLKSMDEDLAELSDSKDPGRHWLWPLTREVFWHGVYEREKFTAQGEGKEEAASPASYREVCEATTRRGGNFKDSKNGMTSSDEIVGLH